MTEFDAHREQTLRNALRATTGNSDLDAIMYASVAAGIDGDPHLEKVFREETAPDQALLDLHLEGDGVREHQTSAARFATFVKRVSEATKFTAKHMAGLESYPERLLIEGVLPGSLRVVLRAPAIASTAFGDPHPEIQADSSDSSALKVIARVFTSASMTDDDADSAPLLGLVQALPAPARRALRGAAGEVIKGGWEIAGTVRQRRKEEEPIQITQRGAARLHSALKFHPGEPEIEVRIGFFDGLKVSAGTVYFIPTERGGRPFGAAAPTDDLLSQVAHLVAERDQDAAHSQEVRAVFVVSVEDAEPGVPSRRSRRLESITPLRELGEQPRLELR